MSNLKILFWNSNGITHKLNELQALVLKLKIDIILLNETKLSPSKKLHIPNYITYKNDLPYVRGRRAHGGTAVIIHRRITHQPLTLNTTIQSSSVLVKLNDYEILISAVYKPPNAQLTTNDLDILTCSADWQISAGDFNAKHPLWHNQSTNSAGLTLFQHVQQSDYTITAPTSPTHFPTCPQLRPSTLDIALVRVPLLTHIDNLNELSSDHNPILLEVSSSPISSTPPTPKRYINWKKFNQILTDLPNPTTKLPADKQSIDTQIDYLTQNIQHTINTCIFTPSNINRHSSKTLPPELQQEITDKNRLRREWQRTRDPTTKRQLNAKISLVRNILETHKIDSWDIFLNSLDQHDHSIYKLNKSLLHKRPASHPLTGPNGLVFDATDRAELMADSLETQFRTNPGPDIPDVTTNLHRLNKLPPAKSNTYTTPGTVQQIIRDLRKNKSPGDDLISNTALKFLPNNVLLMLTNIFNSCFKINYFPTAWKKAVIISIPKPGKDHKQPANYRPIALLSSLSKIYERLIHVHLQNALQNKLRPEQFAFRPEHSTTKQLTKLTHQLSENLNNDLHTASVFLDVEKAFDRVWHAGLLYKLSLLDIPTNIIKIIQSFLEDRTFLTKIENSFSTTRHILAGVPQGSCLAPTLYLIYINDIPTTDKAKLSLFADDTMFFTSNKNPLRAIIQLQKQLDLTATWFRRWRIKINATKTVGVLFGRKLTTHLPRLTIDNQPINWSPHVKYLGVTIGRQLTFGHHITNITKKATRVRGMLYPILNKNSPVPTRTKLTILQLYISPILTYAGPSWAPFTTNTQWKHIESVQNIGLRTITGMPTYVNNKTLLRSAHLKSIQDSIQSQSKSMFLRNSFSKHDHIRLLGKTYTEPTTKKKPKPYPITWAEKLT